MTNSQSTTAAADDECRQIFRATFEPIVGTETGKQERLRRMLARKEGATLEQLCLEFGWQAHSARAAISGLRKAGHQVHREKGASGSVYRLRG
ncbi:DUF3489 domain-containing protein [Seohaeicola zhoushanensis]|uniref:DUF3489 domain-containing protein n=1 Tax=Seohaeicola zhoushanensis TaxID=1569283 RepID=A0A8J3H3M8_9RHOB|nr:DUF3489 domain-containing protein [Seohaeicola zhoushanensis]GHF72476.1 hypothetical protein GCM10017056_49240 [Seohaeicola zhoushanensis]